MRVIRRVKLVVGVVLLVTVPLLLLSRSHLCSQSALATVCGQVEEGLAVGDMCRDLCHLQTVRPGGASDKAGVREGDVIIKVNGQQVTESLHGEVVKLIQTGETDQLN